MSIIRLTTCNNIVEANFIKNNLENEEIECFLTNEISSTLIPAYNGMLGAGIQIMIEEKDFETASKLISHSESEKTIQCPNCNSTNITFGLGQSKFKKYLLIALSLLIIIPLGNLKGNYQCKDCKHNF
ncbi:MAG: DUF2007 domain-containing protein [Paludibacter sp.]